MQARLLSLALASLVGFRLAHALPTTSLVERAGDTTSVSLDQCSGTPQLYGQGVLYGLGVDANTPPQSYLSDLKINYNTAGGAQLDSTPAGYAASMNSYKARFATAVTAYKRIRQNGGVFVLAFADLWGADETTGGSFPFPGDNGDWTKYDAFIQQVISDIKANGMAVSYVTQLNVWNEPDINFGGRPQSQFNAMWVRGAKALKVAFGSSTGSYLPLCGPATASAPYNGNGWWQNHLSYLQQNGGSAVQPDVWTWHMEGGGNNDPIPPAQYLPGFLSSYGLTNGIGFQVSEYATRAQQTPSWSGWFKARFERLQFHGQRGNWGRGKELLDLLAQLLIKNSDGSYSTTGDYMDWKYYAQMSGAPCKSVSGNSVDSFAVASSGAANALIGSQGYTGAVNVVFNGVNSRFGTATKLKATLIKIPYANGGVVTAWQTNKTLTVPVSNNAATVSYTADDANDGWAITLAAA